jgi:hypothetical protein
MQTMNVGGQDALQMRIQDDSRFGIVPERPKAAQSGEVEGLLR